MNRSTMIALLAAKAALGASLALGFAVSPAGSAQAQAATTGPVASSVQSMSQVAPVPAFHHHCRSLRCEVERRV
ncbi:MAG: hypothetical protein JOY78_20315 [Pseudonocardia sp.]|nr:hypothetical protein [Pseudonocardia sp.]